MTSATRFKVTCKCGHAGIFKHLEYDFVFGHKPDIFEVEDAFIRVAPGCPRCGEELCLDQVDLKNAVGRISR